MTKKIAAVIAAIGLFAALAGPAAARPVDEEVSAPHAAPWQPPCGPARAWDICHITL